MPARRLLGRPQRCYIPGMSLARSLLVVLCAAQAGHGAFAASVIAPPAVDMAQVVEPAARKGTRAYKSDGVAPAVPADAAAGEIATQR